MNKFPLLTCFAAGLLSALGFAPLGLWPITIAALAVLIDRARSARSLRSALACGYLFGFGHFLVGLNWIAGAFIYQDAMPAAFGWGAVAIVAGYISVYPAMTAATAWRFGRDDKLRFTLLFAATWIVTEWLRATLFTGFAWNPLGVILIDILLVRDTARIFGTYGISAWVTIIAGLLTIWGPRYIHKIRANWQNGTWLSFAIGGPLIAAVFIIITAAALNRIDLYTVPKPSPRPLIRIVQPNIGQQDKHVEAFDSANFAKLARLTGAPGTVPRLIFWPEAAVPDYLDEDDAEAQDARARIKMLLGPGDVLLTGGVKRYFKQRLIDGYLERDMIGANNSLFALDSDAKLLGRYDKSHLVPGGEYLPMKAVLSQFGLSRLVPGNVDFWPGPGARTLALGRYGRAGVQICYEIIFSGHVIDRSNRPDFLFNPSNDAWFGTWGPPQHLAQARLRAIEEAMPIIRSTPTGISAVIDARGAVRQSIAYQRAGAIEMRAPEPAAPSLFARFGNIVPMVLAALLAVIGIALRRRAG